MLLISLRFGALRHVQNVLSSEGVKPEMLPKLVDCAGVEPVNIDPPHGAPRRTLFCHKARNILHCVKVRLLRTVVENSDENRVGVRWRVNVGRVFDPG